MINRELFYRFEHRAKQRYYCVDVATDLFGDVVLTRMWGGLNKTSGRMMRFPCTSFEEAAKQVDQIVKLRMKSGYEQR